MTDAPGPEAEFRAHLAQGRFMLQRSAATGAYMFPPRTAAPGTGARDLEWTPASGKGVVYATTVSRRRPEQGGPVNIALIELAEGPRMMSRVDGVAPEDVAIGMPVRARIEEVLGDLAVVWVPAEDAA
ncbi:MAG: OB-fold domain-containing protein [Pseudomonadota bacterium]